MMLRFLDFPGFYSLLLFLRCLWKTIKSLRNEILFPTLQSIQRTVEILSNLVLFWVLCLRQCYSLYYYWIKKKKKTLICKSTLWCNTTARNQNCSGSNDRHLFWLTTYTFNWKLQLLRWIGQGEIITVLDVDNDRSQYVQFSSLRLVTHTESCWSYWIAIEDICPSLNDELAITFCWNSSLYKRNLNQKEVQSHFLLCDQNLHAWAPCGEEH